MEAVAAGGGAEQRRQERLGVEHHEMTAVPSSNRLDQPDVHAGERLARLELVRRNFEEIVHPADRQSEAAVPDVHHQERTLVLRERHPIQQSVRIDDREERTTDVDQTEDGVGGTRDPGGREGRQDFTGPAGKHPAGQVAHLKYDDAHRLGVSHLY